MGKARSSGCIWRCSDGEYANWRAYLRVRYGKIDAPIKIDIATGDEIVPGRMSIAIRSCSRRVRCGFFSTHSRRC